MILSIVGIAEDQQSTVKPSSQTLTVPEGETGTIKITVTHPDGTAYNLTGAQLLLAVSSKISRQATIDSAAAGTAHFPLVIADTLSLLGSYSYDVSLTASDGSFYRVVPASSFVVTAGIGQPGQPVTVPATQQPLAQGPAGPTAVGHIEEGFSAITDGVGNTHDYLDVTFGAPFAAATGIGAYIVDVQISLTTATDPGIVCEGITNKTLMGCRINFSGAFNGEVRWKAYDYAASAATLPLPAPSVIAGTGLTGGGVLSGNVTLAMPAVGPGAATTGGGAAFVNSITTDAQGRITAATSGTPAGSSLPAFSGTNGAAVVEGGNPTPSATFRKITLNDLDASSPFTSLGNLQANGELIISSNGDLMYQVAYSRIVQGAAFPNDPGGLFQSPQLQIDWRGSAPIATAGPVFLGNDGSPYDAIYARRKLGKGSALVAGNFVLSAGWGSTASVTSVVGDDGEFIITVSSSGTGQAANPTITLLYQDGTWDDYNEATHSPPIPVAKMANASTLADMATAIAASSTPLRLTMTFVGTPVATRTYTIAAHVVGFSQTPVTNATNAPPVPVQKAPNMAAKKIMCIGDSITLGSRIQPYGGYRTYLWTMFQEYGVTPTMVGDYQDGPPALGDKHHNGISGAPIETLQTYLATWFTNNPNPDAILLHAGSNNSNVTTALSSLGTFLNTILADTTTTHIFLAQIAPRTVPEDAFVTGYNAGMATTVAGTTAPSRITIVNIHDAMNAVTDIVDTIHPNARGYQKMATMWWNALGAFFV